MERLGWWAKWRAWLFPSEGWARRVALHNAGKTAWEVPNQPEKPQTIPFPITWVPHRPDPSRTSGFELLGCICTDSGREAPVGEAVCCARCEVPLHEQHAGVLHKAAVPSCGRCRRKVKIATL